MCAVRSTSDVRAVDVSPLKLQNAETERVLSGSKRLVLTMKGYPRQPMRGQSKGPAQMVERRGYSIAMAISTLRICLQRSGCVGARLGNYS
eukprot:2474661-Pleurochrysis_carterae.AAC.3